MNKTIEVRRQLLDNCSIGKWYYRGSHICYSVEKPWLSNLPFKSCIPPGEYQIGRHYTTNRPNSFILINENLGVGKNKGDSVRYGCLIHVANFPDEVKGCLGPGLYLHPKKWGVSQSRNAMKMLNQLIDGDDWKMRIIQ